MMYVKIHRSEHTEIIAVCDKSLLGKTVNGEGRQAVIQPEFYKGKLMNKDEVINLLKSASNANLFGEESVSCGIEAKIISEGHIITIGGVKHAQFYSA
ncbi:MAG: DUF424 family protein [Nanoarchaeota archaeon]|nr:DUF424 family protein [Nanoarchaeota archaeon]